MSISPISSVWNVSSIVPPSSAIISAQKAPTVAPESAPKMNTPPSATAMAVSMPYQSTVMSISKPAGGGLIEPSSGISLQSRFESFQSTVMQITGKG